MTQRPSSRPDGTITAIVADTPTTGNTASIVLELPPGLAGDGVAGRYVLARCGAQTMDERAENWQIYLRRPLYACGLRRSPGKDDGEWWEFLLPPGDDVGGRWLASLSAGASVNLIGPLGGGYRLDSPSRNLLLLGNGRLHKTLTPLIDEMLDRGGRVTLLLAGDAVRHQPWIAQLPLPVEVRLVATTADWDRELNETLPWADQLCAAIPETELSRLAEAIRNKRFRLEPGFAQTLVEADLLCGVGACLACAVARASGGYTRACVHGPVFDLTHLVR
ncbi:MAG: hypothetical protein HC802_21010 [Caldilineaceae bacterium]|nr:hypothetical protein [Caldilineaceae bacterium]